MKTILLAAKALNEINSAQLSFADFSNRLRGKEFQELNFQEKREIRTFVSCALHKNQIVNFALLQHGLDKLDNLTRSLVTVYLCNVYFLKIVSVTRDDLLAEIRNEEDKKLVEENELIKGTVRSLFPDKLDFKTSFALSLRYNFPLNFVERLIEDLGFNKTQRFLEKFSNVYQIHGRLNLSKVTSVAFFANNPDFKEIPLLNGFVYEGKHSIKNLDTYKDCSFYTMPITDLVISEQLLGFAPQTVLIKEIEKTSMLIDLPKLNPSLKVEVEVSDKHRYHVVSSVTKMFDLPNVFVATSDRFEEGKTYDLVYVTPTSSNLDQIKARPDFFIDFDLDKDYSEGILELLHKYQTKVNPNGVLVVKIGSLLKKETTEISQKFVEAHPDYTLEFERQYMPYHKERTIAYYAIFRKN